MWHLLSIITTRLRNISFVTLTPVVIALHGIFLLLFCVRFMPLTAIQLKRTHHNVVKFVGGKSGQGACALPVAVPQKPVRTKKVKPVAKKIVKKSVPKIAPKKIEKPAVKKKPAPVPEPVVKQIPKKEEPVVKPVEKPVEKPLVPVSEVVQQSPIELQMGAVVPGADQVVSPAEIIHARILEVWHPPRNVKPRSACVLRVVVGKGKLESKPEVQSSSGSSAFDMTARSALLAITYPPEFWNRVLIIHFS